jgi:hypothetical protein
LDTKIELSASLWERLVQAAQARGYESPQQYVIELIERDLAKEESSVSDDEITHKMEELGYLDFGRDI